MKQLSYIFLYILCFIRYISYILQSILYIKSDIILSCIRLTYGFIISSVICSFFNIDSLLIKVFIIQYSMPSAVFNFILADKYNKNPDRVASIVFVSTLLSLFTIPVILYFLMK